MSVDVQKIERDGYTAELLETPNHGWRYIQVTGPGLHGPMEWLANADEPALHQMQACLERAAKLVRDRSEGCDR